MRSRSIAVLTIAIVLLLSATVGWIQYLGLEYDEAHFLPLAVKIAYGAEERLELPWGFTIADRPVPFVTMPYVGTLDAFVYAVPYRMFGTGLAVSRGTNLFLAVLIFGLVWWLARREVGIGAAAGALALLVVDVELVLHIPTHFGPFLLQQLLALVAIAALQQWWKAGSKGWFFLAVGALALAFHEKLTFIWILSALAVAIVLFQGKATWRESRWWFYPAGLLLAVVIVSPILYFAYAVPEVILGFGKASAKVPADLGKVFAERWHVFDMMMRGHWTMEFTVGAPPEALHRGPALMGLFFVGMAAAVVARQRMALVLYGTAVGVWVWNLAFPDAGRMHHVLLMAPFWQLGAGIAIASVARPVQVLSLALVLWSGWDATRCYRWYTAEVQRTGGINHWSDMTSRAVEWLEAHPRLEPVTTSWGVARPLLALSAGRLNPVEHYFDTLAEPLSAEANAQLLELIGKERQVWLVSNVMPIYEEQWQRVVALGRTVGKPPLHLKTFYSRDGRYRLAAYTFTPTALAPVEWKTVTGGEFGVGTGQIRMKMSGEARGEAESITLSWLDGDGKLMFSDTRNFHWTPQITKQAVFEFSPTYWPMSFRRQGKVVGMPVKVRLEANLKPAQITSIEVSEK